MFARLFTRWSRRDRYRKGLVRESRRRSIRFEALDARLTMAGDLGWPGAAPMSPSAEGEAAPDLVAFAKALTAAGNRYFGGDWVQQVTDNLALFKDGAAYLNYIEATGPDHKQNQTAVAENIVAVPTWKFASGEVVADTLSLESVSTRSGIAIPLSSSPSFFPVGSQVVKLGSPLHIPIDAYDPNDNPLTISVSSSNPQAIEAVVLQGNPSARVTVEGYGEMVFQLFASEAPRPVERFVTLANNGFYNTVKPDYLMKFHRASRNQFSQPFVIQGGDPNGNGTGGSNLGDFDDQFNFNLQHNRSGVLSYAKRDDDTNDSQFFVTADETRFLDYNHSVFGQLIEGDKTRAAINRIATLPGERPFSDVIIKSIEIFNDVENGLVRLIAKGAPGATSEIRVMVTDTEGNQFSQTFTAAVEEDDANGSPFLGDITNGLQLANRPINLTLAASDEEEDPIWYGAVVAPGSGISVQVNENTGQYRITPDTGFVGRASFRALVARGPLTADDLNFSSNFDGQIVNIDFVAPFTLSIDKQALFEGTGADRSATVTVTRPSFTGTSDLEIQLSSSVPGRLNMPTSVTIPANQFSLTFQVSTIEGTALEGTQDVSIRGNALSYDGATTVKVYDDDSPSQWHNVNSPFDTDNDGRVAPVDVLVVINQLARATTAWLPNASPVPVKFVDTNNDYFLTPIDALRVINELNRSRSASGEGESSDGELTSTMVLSLWLNDEVNPQKARRGRVG